MEQLESLGLVFVQRVALRIAPESHYGTQMLQPQEMLPPLGINGLQKHLLFNLAQVFRSEFRGFRRHHLIGLLRQPFQDVFAVHAFLAGPFDHSGVDAKLFQHGGIKALGIPLVRIALGRNIKIDKILDNLMAHVLDYPADILGIHYVAALAEDHLALIVHDIIEFQQLLADVEIAPFDFRLRLFKGLVDPRMNDGFAFLHAQPPEHPVEPFGAEYAHQVIFKTQIEGRPARIALATGAAAQLVVDPPAFMALGRQHEQAARILDRLLVGGMLIFDLGADLLFVASRSGCNGLQNVEFDIAAQFDVGPSSCHVCCYGDGAELARFRNDLRLLLVLTRIQDIVGQFLLSEHFRERLGLFNACRAHKHWLALLMRRLYLIDDGRVFLPGSAVDGIVVVLPHDWQVRGDFNNPQAVDLLEFLGFGRRRPGHAGELFIQAEVVLERDRGKRQVLRLYRAPLLRLDRLVQAFGEPAASHHPPGELVDQHDIVAADDVILVLREELVRPQSLVHMVDNGCRLRVIESLAVRQNAGGVKVLLEKLIAVVRECHVPGFLVQRIMAVLQVGNDFVDRGVKIGPVLRRAGDDQRRARLVYEDRIHLVHDGEAMVPLKHVAEFRLHVVAQVIEAQFVVCGIGDVARVGRFFLLVGLLRVDDPRGHAQRRIDLAHPVGIALGEIVVHCDDMHAALRQGIEVGRERGDKGLAFPGLHFGDIALMQEDAAHKLHVESPQAERPLRGLAAIREGLGQDFIKSLASCHALNEFGCLFLQVCIRQCFEFRLKRIDLLDHRAG